MRQANIYRKGMLAGMLTEDGGEYRFRYDSSSLQREDALPVSLTLPLQEEAFVSPVLFPFFDGLIPEGWLLNVVERNWKIDGKDRFGLLLVTLVGKVAFPAWTKVNMPPPELAYE